MPPLYESICQDLAKIDTLARGAAVPDHHIQYIIGAYILGAVCLIVIGKLAAMNWK